MRRDARMYAVRLTDKGEGALQMAMPAAARRIGASCRRCQQRSRTRSYARLSRIVSTIGPVELARRQQN